MTAAIPRTKAEELIAQLTELGDNQAPIDEITSRRLKRDIEQSKAVDAVGAFIARGILAVLEWDMPTVRSSFEAAISLGRTCETLDHYATSLQMLGDYDGATDVAERAYELARTDLGLLRKAITYSYLAGRFNRAKELCDMYDLLSPSEPHHERLSVEQALQVLTIGGFTEELAVQCNRIAFDLLRERKIIFIETSSEGDIQDGLILLRIFIAADPETAEQLDVELGERLFDQVGSYNPSHYWIGYESKQVAQ